MIKKFLFSANVITFVGNSAFYIDTGKPQYALLGLMGLGFAVMFGSEIMAESRRGR